MALALSGVSLPHRVGQVSANVVPLSQSGTGTVGDPFVVSSCSHLLEIDDSLANLSKAYVIGNNIDCSQTVFSPLKNGASSYFSGILDGQNYTISGLSISCAIDDCGLFARVANGATIKNMTFASPTIDSSAKRVGLIAGTANGLSTIDNITINGGLVRSTYASTSKSDETYVGGLIGYARDGAISNISSSLEVTGAVMTGGLVGVSLTAGLSITDVEINGDVTGETYTGGVIGHYFNAAVYGLTITRATVGAIVVSGWQDVGGFLGFGWNIKVDSSDSRANVIGQGTAVDSSGIGDGAFVGGVAGQLSGGDSTIVDTTVRGNVTTTYRDFNAQGVGGLVGWARLTKLIVTRTSFHGDIVGHSMIGAITGRQSLEVVVTDSYFRANLTATATSAWNLGGFVGTKSSTALRLTRSYYVGTQSLAVGSRASIVSFDSGTTACADTFFDSSVLGTTRTSGTAGICTSSAKTTAEMKTQSTFTNFDFTANSGVWSIDPAINDGYPFLRQGGDITAPTASWTPPQSPASTRTLSYVLSFSEQVSGISASDFSATGTASPCTFTPSATSTSSSITVSVSCVSDGTVIVQLASNSILDAAMNSGPLITVSDSSVSIDTTVNTTTTSSTTLAPNNTLAPSNTIAPSSTTSSTIPSASNMPANDGDALASIAEDVEILGQSGFVVMSDGSSFGVGRTGAISLKLWTGYIGKASGYVRATYKVGKVTKKWQCSIKSVNIGKIDKKAKRSSAGWFPKRFKPVANKCVLPPQLRTVLKTHQVVLTARVRFIKMWPTTGKAINPDTGKKIPVGVRTLRVSLGKPAT